MVKKDKTFKPMDLSAVRLDPSKVNEGVRLLYSPGFWVTVARYNNPSFQNYVTKEVRRLGRGTTKEDLISSFTETIEKEAGGRYILLGWENMIIDGVKIPYSVEKSIELCTAPEWALFWETIKEMSQDEEHFRAMSKEELEKNSKSVSPTNSVSESQDSEDSSKKSVEKVSG